MSDAGTVVDWARAEQVAIKIAARRPAPDDHVEGWAPPIEQIEDQIEVGHRPALGGGHCRGAADRPAGVDPGQHRLVPRAARPRAGQARRPPSEDGCRGERDGLVLPPDGRGAAGHDARVDGRPGARPVRPAGATRRRRRRRRRRGVPRRPEPRRPGAALRLRARRSSAPGCWSTSSPTAPSSPACRGCAATSPAWSTRCSAASIPDRTPCWRRCATPGGDPTTPASRSARAASPG